MLLSSHPLWSGLHSVSTNVIALYLALTLTSSILLKDHQVKRLLWFSSLEASTKEISRDF